MKKKIKNMMLIILGVVLGLTIGVSAATIASSSVTYGDTTVQAALDELITKVNRKCSANYLCSKASVGDYVSMVPTSTSYVVPLEYTGVTSGTTSDHTINPSELNLWRIISINNDGTIDMVSEYASTKTISFNGIAGYVHYIYILNLIAKQYENSNYTIGSRHMGYNGQTQVITDTSFAYPASLTASTSDNSNETVGGGDIMYNRDVDLVTNAMGTLVANNPAGATTIYWLSSRYYQYNSATTYLWAARGVSKAGGLSNGLLYYNNNGTFSAQKNSSSIRPIVTLKSDVQATSDSPWVLA